MCVHMCVGVRRYKSKHHAFQSVKYVNAGVNVYIDPVCGVCGKGIYLRGTPIPQCGLVRTTMFVRTAGN